MGASSIIDSDSDNEAEEVPPLKDVSDDDDSAAAAAAKEEEEKTMRILNENLDALLVADTSTAKAAEVATVQKGVIKQLQKEILALRRQIPLIPLFYRVHELTVELLDENEDGKKQVELTTECNIRPFNNPTEPCTICEFNLFAGQKREIAELPCRHRLHEECFTQKINLSTGVILCRVCEPDAFAEFLKEKAKTAEIAATTKKVMDTLEVSVEVVKETPDAPKSQ
jgi:hypothetical protein